MEKFPDIKNSESSEFNIFYRSEFLHNTNYPGHESLNSRRPDAYVGFTNDIFLYPQPSLMSFDDDLEWYDDI